MKRIFFALILFNSSLFFAQNDNPAITFEIFRESNNKENNKIEGLPYFDDNFSLARIQGVEKTFKARYNVFLDQFEIRYEGETFVLPKDDRYSTLTHQNSKYVLLNFDGKGNFDKNYFIESYSDNKITLLKKERIKIKEKKEATTGYSSDVPARYIPLSPEFYLKLNEEKIIEFPKNKKVLVETFPNFKEKITQYLKENKPSFKKEADLIELTKFLGSL